MSERDLTELPGQSVPSPPPASFEFLIMSVVTEAQVHLGLLDFGDGPEQPEPDLALARHTIDLLGMLHEKTKGNLTPEESLLLENSLAELRFRFVQAQIEK